MDDHNAARQPLFSVQTPDLSSYIETIYRCRVCQFLGDTTEAVTEHLKSAHFSQSLDHSYAGGRMTQDRPQTEKVSDDDSDREPFDDHNDEDDMPSGVAARYDDDWSTEMPESPHDISSELLKKKKNYRCSTAGCRLRFPTQEQRDLHEQCHLQEGGESDGAFRCPTCQVEEGTWENMMIHLGSHSCVFHLYCVVCNCGFSRKEELDRHLAAKHGVNHPDWPLHYKQVHTRKFHHLKQTFSCLKKDCKSYFCNQEELDIHKKCHVDKRTHFQCYICKQVTTTWPSMKSHFQLCHRQCLKVEEGETVDNGTEFEADAKPLYILKESEDSEVLTNGKQENGQSKSPQVSRLQLSWFSCTWEGCKVKYRTEEQLELHSRCHRVEGDNAGFQCPFCQIEPTDWEAMQDHITQHTDLLYLTCEACDKSFPTTGQLDKHFSKQHLNMKDTLTLAQKQKMARRSFHRRKRKYKCENKFCKKVLFFKEEELHLHEQCHIENSPDFRCYVPDCRKAQDTFKSWIKLKCHLASAHNVHIAARDTYTGKQPRTKKDNLPTMCEVCGKVLSGRRNLRKHMRVHEDPLRCPQCPKFSTTRPHMLRAHMEKHRGEGRYRCKECGYFAPIQSELKKHILCVHTEDRPYMCDLCGKFFKFLGNLNHHVQVIHSDTRPFPCKKCNYSSKSKEGLLRHDKRVHSDNKMACPHCGFSTCNKSALEKHMDLHSEDRQHKCPHCTYGFKESNALKRHIEEVHSEKPLHHCSRCSYSSSNHIRMEEHELAHLETTRYNCEICDFKSKWRTSLFRHYKTVHNIQKPVVKLAKASPASDSNILPSLGSVQMGVASEETVPVTSTGEIDGATAILMGLAYGAASASIGSNMEEYVVKTVDWS